MVGRRVEAQVKVRPYLGTSTAHLIFSSVATPPAKKPKTSAELASIFSPPAKKPVKSEVVPKPEPEASSSKAVTTKVNGKGKDPNGKRKEDKKPAIASIFAKPVPKVEKDEKAYEDDERDSASPVKNDEEGEDELSDEAEDEQEGEAAIKLSVSFPTCQKQKLNPVVEPRSSRRSISQSRSQIKGGKKVNRELPLLEIFPLLTHHIQRTVRSTGIDVREDRGDYEKTRNTADSHSILPGSSEKRHESRGEGLQSAQSSIPVHKPGQCLSIEK